MKTKTKTKKEVLSITPEYPYGDRYEKELFKIVVDIEYLIRFSVMPIPEKRKRIVPLLDEYFEFQKCGNKQFMKSMEKRDEYWVTSDPDFESCEVAPEHVFFNTGYARAYQFENDTNLPSDFIIEDSIKVLEKIGRMFYHFDFTGESMRAALEESIEEYFLLVEGKEKL